MKEVQTGNQIREFEYLGKKYIVLKPNTEVVRKSKFQYSLKFVESLKSGLLTKRTLEKELRNADPTFFEEVNISRSKLMEELSKVQKEMEDSTDPDTIRMLSYTVNLLRWQLLMEDQAMNSIYSNTADHHAEEERVSYLAYGTVKNENGSEIWGSYTEFANQEDSTFYDMCKAQITYSEYDIDPNWESLLPEALALKRADELEAKNKEESLAQDQPKEEAEAEAPPQKEEKKTKKKESKSSKKVKTSKANG